MTSLYVDPPSGLSTDSEAYRKWLDSLYASVEELNSARPDDDQLIVRWPAGEYSYKRLVKLVYVDGETKVEVKWGRPWPNFFQTLDTIWANDPNIPYLLERMARRNRSFFTDAVKADIWHHWMVNMNLIFDEIDRQEMERCASPEL